MTSELQEGWLSQAYEAGLVSVIVPTFNRAGLIGETLDSLEAQSWTRLEIVVVDDGSTDDTVARLRARPPMAGGRELRVLTQPNAGVSAARNTGTRAARGEFIVYLDSDDTLLPEAITRYVEALQAEGAEYCFAPIDLADAAGRVIRDGLGFYPKTDGENFPFDRFWLVHGGCYRRRVVNAAGPWNETLKRNEDREFLWRIKTVAGRGLRLEVVQGVYRQHANDQLHRKTEGFYERQLHAMEVFADWLREEGRRDGELRLKLARECRFAGTRLAVEGDRDASRRAFRLAAHLCEGTWHPLRLSPLLGALNAPGVFRLISRVRYQWRWRRTPEKRPSDTGRAGVRPELLFISPVFPGAEGSGPARRAEAVITALGRAYQVTLLVVTTPFHAESRPVAPGYLGGRWTVLPLGADRGMRWRRSAARRFPRLFGLVRTWPVDWNDLTAQRIERARALVDGRRFAVVHAFRLATAPYAAALRAGQPEGTRFQLDVDDIESLTHGRFAALMRAKGERAEAAVYARKARAYARAERLLLPRFDRLFACSETDRRRLQGAHADVRTLPNVVAPASVPGPAGTGRTEGFRLLFVGSFGYYPNQDAAVWFCREVLPRLRAERACVFVAGGRSMPAELTRVIEATAGARSIGEFATAAGAFAQGDALVVPLRAGGGTRIKILEAFAHGRPVVSTAIGIEGIEAVPERDYLAADTPEEFVRQCARLIGDPALCATLADNARRLLAARYSPEVLAGVLAEGPAAANGG